MKSKQATEATITKTQFARQLGVSGAMISKWIAAGLPVGDDDRIAPATARRWLRANVERGAKPRKRSGGPDTESLTEARARKESLQADLKQLELEVRRQRRAATIDTAAEAKRVLSRVADWILRELPDACIEALRPYRALDDQQARHVYAVVRDRLAATLHGAVVLFAAGERNTFTPPEDGLAMKVAETWIKATREPEPGAGGGGGVQ